MIVVSSTPLVHPYSSNHMLMLAGLSVQVLVDLLRAGVCFLAALLFHGNAKSGLLSLSPRRRPSNILFHWQVVKSFGFIGYFENLVLFLLVLLPLMLITPVQSGLLKIQCTISAPNI